MLGKEKGTALADYVGGLLHSDLLHEPLQAPKSCCEDDERNHKTAKAIGLLVMDMF